MLSQKCIVEEDEFGRAPPEIEIVNLTTGRTLNDPRRIKLRRSR